MMKKYLGAGALALVVLFLGVSVAVASATSSPLADEEATLTVSAGTVEVERAGESTWDEVSNSTNVSTGDSIRTNATGEASINLFDQSAIRLDHNTTITLTAADLSTDDSGTVTSSIFVDTGRIWSRVLSFLSPESSFEVTTPTSVATVRGTIFSVWVKDGQSGVYVDEHAVDVQANGRTEAIEEGELVTIDPKSRVGMMVTKELSSDLVNWIGKNRTADSEFDKDQKRKARAESRGIESLIHVAESVRLFVTLDESQKAKLESRFDLRQEVLDRARALEVKNPPEVDTSSAMQIDTDVHFEIVTNGVTTSLDDMMTPTTDQPVSDQPIQ